MLWNETHEVMFDITCQSRGGNSPSPLWGEGVLSSPSGEERRVPPPSGRDRGGAPRVLDPALGKPGPTRGRCRVVAVQATRVPSAREWAATCARGRWALAHRSPVNVCGHVRKRDACSLVCRWSGTGHVWRRVGPPHTPPGGHPPFQGWCKPGDKHTITNVFVSLGLPKPRGRQSYPG